MAGTVYKLKICVIINNPFFYEPNAFTFAIKFYK